MKRIRILFVCHGNICRSPMAEFIMKKLVCDIGRGSDFYIESRATSTEEIWNGVGSPIHRDAKRQLSMHSIPFTERSATLLVKGDYEKYDYFIGMDEANIKNMKRIFGKDPDGKIKKLMDYTENPSDVSDPWYTRNFDLAYNDILHGCKCFLNFVLLNA